MFHLQFNRRCNINWKLRINNTLALSKERPHGFEGTLNLRSTQRTRASLHSPIHKSCQVSTSPPYFPDSQFVPRTNDFWAPPAHSCTGATSVLSTEKQPPAYLSPVCKGCLANWTLSHMAIALRNTLGVVGALGYVQDVMKTCWNYQNKYPSLNLLPEW